MFKNFLKKYGYYVLAFALIIAVGITAGLSGSSMQLQNVPEEVTPPPSGQTQTKPEEMLCPMDTPKVLKWYSDTELFYNATLKQWESHRGVDLASDVSDGVYAVLDGKIIDSSYSYDCGYCLKVEHNNGLVSVYCSLEANEGLKVGDSVTRGQEIGKVGTTAANESGDGKHLHFEVLLNGNKVDPANYLTFENK